MKQKIEKRLLKAKEEIAELERLLLDADGWEEDLEYWDVDTIDLHMLKDKFELEMYICDKASADIDDCIAQLQNLVDETIVLERNAKSPWLVKEVKVDVKAYLKPVVETWCKRLMDVIK